MFSKLLLAGLMAVNMYGASDAQKGEGMGAIYGAPYWTAYWVGEDYGVVMGYKDWGKEMIENKIDEFLISEGKEPIYE